MAVECTTCKFANPDGTATCLACGSRVRAVAAAPPPAQETQAAPPAPPAMPSLPRAPKPPPPRPGNITSPAITKGGEAQMSGIHAALSMNQIADALYDTKDISACLAFAKQAEAAGDIAAAVVAYENALRIDMRNLQVLENLLRTARAIDDFVRESRCLATMSQLVADPLQQADLLIQAAHVSWKRRNEPEKAAFAFGRALELNPDRLDAFLALTEIHHAAGAWSELEVAYQKMIHAHGNRADRNPILLAKLWRKLGVLLAQQGKFDDADIALRSAIKLDPGDIKNHATTYEIYRLWPGRWKEAVTALQILIEKESDAGEQIRNLRMLAEIYVEQGQTDAAFCALRVLSFLGAAEEHEAALVSELQRKLPLIPEVTLTTEMWLNYVYPTDFPHDLSQVYGLLALAVHDTLTHDIEDHGTTPKNQIDTSKPLMFNNLIRRVSTVFGLDRVPEIYTRDSGVDGLGIMDGFLDPPGFIIDRSLLSGRTPQDVAFCTTRQLAFQKQSIFIASVCSLPQMKTYLMAALKFTRPDSPIPNTGDIAQIIKLIKTKLTADQQQNLQNLVNKLLDAGGEIALEHYMHRAEDVANRLAFLICDDLPAVAAALNRCPDLTGTRSLNQRLEAVIHYAISPEYVAIRQILGLAVA